MFSIIFLYNNYKISLFLRARKNIYKNMCHKCHVSYSNANLGTASSLLERSAEVQLILCKDNYFWDKKQGNASIFYLFSFQYIFRKLNAHDLLIIDDFGMKWKEQYLVFTFPYLAHLLIYWLLPVFGGLWQNVIHTGPCR